MAGRQSAVFQTAAVDEELASRSARGADLDGGRPIRAARSVQLVVRCGRLIPGVGWHRRLRLAALKATPRSSECSSSREASSGTSIAGAAVREIRPGIPVRRWRIDAALLGAPGELVWGDSCHASATRRVSGRRRSVPACGSPKPMPRTCRSAGRRWNRVIRDPLDVRASPPDRRDRDADRGDTTTPGEWSGLLDRARALRCSRAAPFDLVFQIGMNLASAGNVFRLFDTSWPTTRSSTSSSLWFVDRSTSASAPAVVPDLSEEGPARPHRDGADNARVRADGRGSSRWEWSRTPSSVRDVRHLRRLDRRSDRRHARRADGRSLLLFWTGRVLGHLAYRRRAARREPMPTAPPDRNKDFSRASGSAPRAAARHGATPTSRAAPTPRCRAGWSATGAASSATRST